MSPLVGRWLITTVALFWALGACAADFNTSHVFNPAWPPHARFHSAFQLIVLLATTAIALHITWSGEPRRAALLVAIYPCAFFITPLVPGVAFSDPDQPPRVLGGIPGQLVMASVTLCVLAIGAKVSPAKTATR